MHRALQTIEIASQHGNSAFPVRFRKTQFPYRPERVDLKFVVIQTIAIRIDEDLKIIILEHHRVLFGNRPPDMGLFQLSSDVEKLIVPPHLYPRSELRLQFILSRDVDKIVRPRQVRPGRITHRAIDNNR